VGTAFVNATSNILSTAARQVTAKVSNIIDFEKDLSKVTTTGVDHVKASWGIQVPLGAVMFGQTKDFVISVPSDLISSNQQMRVDVDYLQSGSLEKQIASIEGIENTSDEEVLVQGARVALVALLRDIRKNAKVDNPSEFIPKVTQMSTEVKSLMGAVSIQDDERLSDIAKDLDGQITEATSRSDWYKKWGRHYLPSLAIAHSLQQCHNFKDPGVSVSSHKNITSYVIYLTYNFSSPPLRP
jgi:hypothetical protein